MKRPLRIVLTLLLTGLALGYLVWKVDGNSIGNGGACGNTGK